MGSGVGIAGYAVRATGKRRTKPAVVASGTANVIKAIDGFIKPPGPPTAAARPTQAPATTASARRPQS
jgi:hypothetical protein